MNNFKLSLILALVFFVVGAFFVEAAQMDGYAWSANIGWIGLSGVGVDDNTGNMTGYAWSPHIGWIFFDPNGPYLRPPNHSAKIGDNRISGWARVCSVFQSGCSGSLVSDAILGGFNGWIFFPETDGVTLSGANFSGYAWGGLGNSGSSVIGWIDFRYATTDYKGNYNPDLEYLRIDDSGVDYCDYSSRPPIRVEWKFNSYDPLYDQKSYRIEILSGGTEVYSREVSVLGGGPTFSQLFENIDGIVYGGTYTARLKIENSEDEWSDWIDTPGSITLPAHHYPIPIFTYNPENPTMEDEVTFDGSASRSGDATLLTFKWTFPASSQIIGSLTSPIVKVKFQDAGKKMVALEVTDNDGQGFSCKKEEEIGVKYPLPDWKEITPFGRIGKFLGSVFSFLVKN